MAEKPTHVVVLGGGYAGTLAANRLRKGAGAADVDVTLVNPRPEFVQRIRLHQFVAGDYPAAVDFGTLLGEGVTLVVDKATRIDTDAGQVELASGRTLGYDYVIYAVGSTAAVSDSVRGAAEFAYPIGEFEHATRLRHALDDAGSAAPVTVVGAGLTGTETAAELAEQGRNVTLVCGGRLVPSLSERGRRATARGLRKLGVTILEDDVVTEVRRDAVVFADGAVRPSAVTIWTAGFGVPGLAAASGLRTDALGRLLTDETLTSVDDDRVVAAGDCASPSGAPLRMSCQSASQLGPQAADTVLSRIAGDAPPRFEYGFAGSNVSLGRRAAVIQFARKDDTATRFFVPGRLGAMIKEAVCKGTVWGIRREARKPGSSFWFKGGPRPQQPVTAGSDL
ncbi:NAD(P)/FAD-dependent oxidoreductase [Mycolicibacterium sp. XJ1819]